MHPTLRPLGFEFAHFNISDPEKFDQAITLLKESLFCGGATLFSSDNLICWNHNYSFLREDFFRNLAVDPATPRREKMILWRTYILTYLAQFAVHAPGDFVEMGCHEGATAEKLIRFLDFASLEKDFYLYDLFEWNEGDTHSRLPGHANPQMYEDVLRRFADYGFVRIIRGSVPKSLSQGFPDTIAFAHVDMNHPDAEAGGMEAILPRLSKGGCIVLDDYGWWGYSAQKIALDPIVAAHGLRVLELPTGQGIILKS